MDLKSSIAAVVEALVGRKLKWLARWPAIALQRGELYDTVPDDAMVRGQGQQNVKMVHGLPGFRTVTPPDAGVRLQLSHEAGDPKRPYVAGWDPEAAVDEVEFVDGASSPVARVGDFTGGLYIYQDTVTNIVYLWAAPAGPWLPVSAGAGAPAFPAPIIGTNVINMIATGNTKFLA